MRFYRREMIGAQYENRERTLIERLLGFHRFVAGNERAVARFSDERKEFSVLDGRPAHVGYVRDFVIGQETHPASAHLRRGGFSRLQLVFVSFTIRQNRPNSVSTSWNGWETFQGCFNSGWLR